MEEDYEVKSVVVYNGVELHLPFDANKVQSDWARETAIKQFYDYTMKKKKAKEDLDSICRKRWGDNG